MVEINLNDQNHRLAIEPARDAVRLYQGAAGAKLELTVRVIDSHGAAAVGNLALAATVYVSNSSQQGRRYLGRVQAGHHVLPVPRGSDVQLNGFVSDEQLRAIEEIRKGGTMWLTMTFEVAGMLTEPLRPSLWTGDLSFSVRGGEWADQLETIEAASLVEILVPMPDGVEDSEPVKRLREARQHLRRGQVVAALGSARLALDPVLESVRKSGLANSAKGKQPRDRDLPERFANLVEATYSTLSGASHDDEVTKDFVYTRPEAEALVATTGGLVKRFVTTRS
jgi:hypothetical protein